MIRSNKQLILARILVIILGEHIRSTRVFNEAFFSLVAEFYKRCKQYMVYGIVNGVMGGEVY